MTIGFNFHDTALINRIKSLLAAHHIQFQQFHLLKGDASSRHYLRIDGKQKSLIIMAYCPKEIGQRFLKIQALLHNIGVRVPEILGFEENNDVTDPLILLEDFGDQSFGWLTDQCHEQERVRYYRLALDVLNYLHQHFTPSTPVPTTYNHSLWLSQLQLLPEIMAVDQAGTNAFQQIWQGLLQGLEDQPQTLLLRDYHLDNMMWLPNEKGIKACGLLDFQDAGLGHPLYDVVSLLEEARRDLSQKEREALLDAYQKISSFTFNEIWYHRLAMLRHCRVLAIFTKLSQEGKITYKQHIPRVRHMLAYHLAYPDLKDLQQWFKHYLPVAQ